MILYIDETENEQYFIIAGLLADSKLAVDNSFKHFKNSVRKMKIKRKHREQIFVEFKSKILDRRFQNMKLKMLKEIVELGGLIIYSCCIKKDSILKQSIKEKIYIQSLKKIVSSITDEIDIIYDEFRIERFEYKIKKIIETYQNVKRIIPMNSELEAGLMYVDNLCSVIRLHLSNEDKYKFYDYIKDISIEV